MKIKLACVQCDSDFHIDVRWLYFDDSYHLELHCESHTGGCNFYRTLRVDYSVPL